MGCTSGLAMTAASRLCRSVLYSVSLRRQNCSQPSASSMPAACRALAADGASASVVLPGAVSLAAAELSMGSLQTALSSRTAKENALPNTWQHSTGSGGISAPFMLAHAESLKPSRVHASTLVHDKLGRATQTGCQTADPGLTCCRGPSATCLRQASAAWSV